MTGQVVGSETWSKPDGGTPLLAVITYTGSPDGPVTTVTQEAMHGLLSMAGFTPEAQTWHGQTAVRGEASRLTPEDLARLNPL